MSKRIDWCTFLFLVICKKKRPENQGVKCRFVELEENEPY